jgi:hypothetical protein
MVSVPNPLIFLTDPRIRNPELWMPINYDGSGSGIYLEIFVSIEKDIVKKFRNFLESLIFPDTVFLTDLGGQLIADPPDPDNWQRLWYTGEKDTTLCSIWPLFVSALWVPYNKHTLGHVANLKGLLCSFLL